MSGWIQCPITYKLIPREEYARHVEKVTMVRADIEPFVSPVDGRPIYSRRGLREHNHIHGVTDPRDYGDGYFERKKKERDRELTASSAAQKKARIEAIQEAVYRHGG